MSPTTPERSAPILEGRPAEPERPRGGLARLWPRRAWQRWLLSLCLTLLVLIGATLGLRLWWGARTARALAARIEALRARGQPVTLEDFQAAPIPDEQNAATLLTQAQSLLDSEPASSAAVRLLDDYYLYPELIARDRARVVELLDQLRPVLECVEQARGRVRCQWPTPLTHPVIQVLFPYVSSMRTVGRILAVRAVERADAGDCVGAVAAIEDGLNLADWVQDEPPSLVAHLVGIAITAVDLVALETILPRLAVAPPAVAAEDVRPVPRERLQRLIQRLLDEQTPAVQWRRAVWFERMSFLDSVTALGRGTLPLTPNATTGPGRPRVGDWLLMPMYNTDAMFVLRHLTAWAEAAQQPTWPGALAQAPRYPKWNNPFERLSHLLSSIIMPSLERTFELHYRALAARRMAAVAIALRLYELDHGRRPETLDALVPDYLAAIPVDPFADPPAPLRYAPANNPPVIYSVNSDGKDDGGKFALKKEGTVDNNAMDLVWFLNGDRPTGTPPSHDADGEPNAPPTTQPSPHAASTQRGEDQPAEEHHPR